MSTPLTDAKREELRAQLRKPLSSSQRFKEWCIEKTLLACGLLCIGVTLSILLVLLAGSVEFFGKKEVHSTVDGRQKRTLEWMTPAESFERISYFFTGTEWNDVNSKFGVIPLLIGTLWIAVIAGAVAIPIGLVTAIYLSEYASPRVRSIAKPTLELLAGIPSIVFGFFAITVITPLLMTFIPGLNIFNQISGGLVVGIMIIPTVASLSEDALRSVPRSLRDGSIALGANHFETSTKVVFPAALSGVIASFILAFSRAIGETMAVSLACGEKNEFTLDPRQGITTLTSFIVRRSKGEMEHDSIEYKCLFAVGLLLFLITLSMNMAAQKILKRYRQVYQ